jgi:hypothetical protein
MKNNRHAFMEIRFYMHPAGKQFNLEKTYHNNKQHLMNMKSYSPKKISVLNL